MAYINIVFTVVLWLLLPAAVVYTIYRVVRRGYELKDLVERGVEGRARVTHKQLFRRKGLPTKRLIYVFKGPDGKNYKRHSLVGSELFDAAKENHDIDIVYLPDKPAVNAPRTLVDQARTALEKKRKQHA